LIDSKNESRLAVPFRFGTTPEKSPTPTFVLQAPRLAFTPHQPDVTVKGQGMGTLRTNNRRREPRIEAYLVLTVWGVDTRGDRFLQEARARDLSLSGALLSGLDAELRSGDVIGILYAGKKARYRVVWVRESGNGQKVQAAVHRIAPDECPGKDLLNEEQSDDPPTISAPAP
jgi:hypothetical protein